jgi:tuberous sclerosis 2
MPSQVDDANRPTRQRSNTTFTPFNWRRTRTDTAIAPPTEPAVPLSLEALIEALTPPAVPSIHHARALASVLMNVSPTPRLTVLNPIIASLCAADSPVSLQAAGFDILAAYWENSGSVTLTTADRLTCLALFMDFSIPWTPELWEPRFKALLALIHSGTETNGIEQSLLKIMRTWIDGAFVGLTSDSTSPEERSERHRSVDALIGLLTALVGRPEFASRLSESDTNSVLQLFGSMIDRSLAASWDNMVLPNSLLSDINLISPTSNSRVPPKHHRHQSSVSVPQTANTHSAADIAVEAYLNYLAVRLKAIASTHLKTILPHLFRALSHYASPLPRLSLTTGTEHQNDIEKRIIDVLDSLVTGPFSSSCTMILKYHLYPDTDEQIDVATSARTSLGALRTLRTSIRRLLMARLARAYISRTSSVSYTPSGAPGSLEIDRELMDRAWAKEDITTWDLNRFRLVLCDSIQNWLDVAGSIETALRQPCELILSEVAGILKDTTQAFDEIGDELDYEEVEAVGEVLHSLTTYLNSQRYAPIFSSRICSLNLRIQTRRRGSLTNSPHANGYVHRLRFTSINTSRARSHGYSLTHCPSFGHSIYRRTHRRPGHGAPYRYHA